MRIALDADGAAARRGRARGRARRSAPIRVELAATGGEDYELCACVPPRPARGGRGRRADVGRRGPARDPPRSRGGEPRPARSAGAAGSTAGLDARLRWSDGATPPAVEALEDRGRDESRIHVVAALLESRSHAFHFRLPGLGLLWVRAGDDADLAPEPSRRPVKELQELVVRGVSECSCHRTRLIDAYSTSVHGVFARYRQARRSPFGRLSTSRANTTIRLRGRIQRVAGRQDQPVVARAAGHPQSPWGRRCAAARPCRRSVPYGIRTSIRSPVPTLSSLRNGAP